MNNLNQNAKYLHCATELDFFETTCNFCSLK